MAAVVIFCLCNFGRVAAVLRSTLKSPTRQHQYHSPIHWHLTEMSDDGQSGQAPVAPPGGVRCPDCEKTCSTVDLYITHVRKKHSDEQQLSNFHIPGLVENLRRCRVCTRICRGARGVAHHLSKAPLCRQIAADMEPEPPPGGPENAQVPLGLEPMIVGDGEVDEIGLGEAALGGVAEVEHQSLEGGVLPANGAPAAAASATVATNDLDQLLSAFSTGLYTVYRSWRKPMQRLSLKLLAAMTAPSISAENEKVLTTAFLLLPGLVNEARLHKKLSVTKLLQKLSVRLQPQTSALDLAKEIIGMAAEWKTLVDDRRARSAESVGRRARQSSTALQQRLETLVRERRLSSAMSMLDKLQELQDLQDRGLAIDGLEQPDLTFDEICQHVGRLNPAADQHDEFTAEQLAAKAAQPALQVDAQLLSSVLSKLPVGSAAGASGWTYGAMKAIFLETDGATEACTVLAQLCNRMLEGRCASQLWLRSRSVLIPKRGSDDWRPLGIGEAWYRLVGRCAVRAEGDGVGQHLLPLQLGCGIRGGCEIAGRMGQLVLDSHPVIVAISLDLLIAFQSIPRALMLRGILRYAPRLAKWFCWAYGGSSPLILSDGRVVGRSATGCRQGDPLAALCFCVGLQFTLEDIKQLIEEKQSTMVLVGDDDPPAPAGLFAYMDDTNLFVHKHIVKDVVEGLEGIFARYRLTLNQQKCRLLGQAAASIVDPPYEVALSGCKIMGAPTGTPDYRVSESQRIVDDATFSLPSMRKIELWSAWSLLRYCVTARVGYLARVVEPEFCFPALAAFDRKVDEVVYDMVGGGGSSLLLESPALKCRINFLRSLPLGLGGLGITRLASLAGEQACLLSRTLTYEFIERHCPELVAGVRVSWRPVVLGATEEDVQPGDESGRQHEVGVVLATGETAIPPDAVDSTVSYEERRAQRRDLRDLSAAVDVEAWNDDELVPAGRAVRAKVRAIHERRCTELIDTLRSSGELTLSDWLKYSCFKGSGRWLAGSGGYFYGRYAFRSSVEYRAALRMRLLLPLASSGVVHHGNAVLCKCGKEVDLLSAPYHPIDCARSEWYWIQRHNATRDLLRDFLKDHSVTQTMRVVVEPEVTDPQVGGTAHMLEAQSPAQRAGAMSIADWRTHRHGNGVLRADLGRFSLWNKQYFDVFVVDPTASSYRIAEPGELAGVDAVVDGTTAATAAIDVGNAGVTVAATGRATASSPAVLARERSKKLNYRPVLGDEVDNTDRLVLFGVEATGRLSTTSTRILRGLAASTRDREGVARFVAQVGAITAKYNAQQIIAWERHLMASCSF